MPSSLLCVALREERRQLAVAVVMLAAFVAPLLIGCKSRETRRRPDPNALRTDYDSLQELVAVIDDAAERIHTSLSNGGYPIARRLAKNLQVYARELKQYTPAGRTVHDIERYDARAGSLEALGYSIENYALQEQPIQGLQESHRVRDFVTQLHRSAGPVEDDERIVDPGRPNPNAYRNLAEAEFPPSAAAAPTRPR